jgi:hypothetical protein
MKPWPSESRYWPSPEIKMQSPYLELPYPTVRSDELSAMACKGYAYAIPYRDEWIPAKSPDHAARIIRECNIGPCKVRNIMTLAVR